MALVGEAAVRIVPSFETFRKRLDAELKATNANLDVQVRPQLGYANQRMREWRAKEEGNALNIDVDVDTNKLRAASLELKRVEHEWQKSPLRQALRVGIVVTGAAALPALVQGAGSALTALTSLAQGAAIIPGVLAGALASFGALATGLGGLGKAFKELDNAQIGSADQAAKVADAQGAAEKSARDLAGAQRDVADAVKDAYRNLQDLTLQLKGSHLSQAEAIINLRKAEQTYYKGGFKDALDQQSAWLDVLDAKQRLDETTVKNTRTNQDFHQAQQDGISQSKGVVGALDAVKDAQNRVADAAQKMADATKGTASFQRAMERLSPAGRDFVQQMYALKPAWQQFQQVVQQHLLAGVADDFRNLAQRELPLFEAGMARVADGINKFFRTTLNSVQTPNNEGFLARIFGNTGAFFDELNRGVQPFMDALLRLSATGSNFLPRIGDAISTVLDKFNAFITKADQDGSLDTWISRGLDGLTKLGDTFLNVGSIIGSIADAYRTVTGNQNGLIDSLSKGTKGLADFFSSVEGQSALVSYLGKIKGFVDEIKPAAGAILSILGAISDGARDLASLIAGPLVSITNFVSENLPIVKTLVTAWLGFKLISPVLGGFASALTAVNTASRLLLPGMQNMPGVLGKAQTGLRNTAEDVGKSTAKGSKGLSGALGGLASFMSPGSLLITAASVGVPLALEALGKAHEKATQQANDQRTALESLKSAMDNVSGAFGAQAAGEAAKQAQHFTVPGVGDRNVLQDVLRTGVATPGQLLKAVNPTQQAERNTQLDKFDKQKQQQIESSDIWARNKDKWASMGIDSLTLAKAANGDAAALSKVNAAESAASGGRTEAGKALLRTSGKLPPTLTDVIQSTGIDTSSSAQFLRNASNAASQSGSAVQQANAAAAGNWTLTPAGQGVFGAGARVFSDGTTTKVDTSGPMPAGWAEHFNPATGTAKTLQDGRVEVTLTPEGERRFAQKMWQGGVVQGVGGRDKNLVAATKGEVMMPLDTVNHYGLDSLLAIKDKRVPRFGIGGWLNPDLPPSLLQKPPLPPPPPPKPAPLPPASPYGGTAAAASLAGSGFQYQGQSQRAHQGLPMPTHPDYPSIGQRIGGLGSAINAATPASYIPPVSAPSMSRSALDRIHGTGEGLDKVSSWGRPASSPFLPAFRGSLGPASRPAPRPPFVPKPSAAARVGNPYTPLPSNYQYGPNKYRPAETPHLTGATPGPVQHLTGGAPGPAIATPVTTSGGVSGPGVGTGPLPGPSGAGDRLTGNAARDFAHTQMMPHWQAEGFTVGDHTADAYGEHQNGAVDVMVPDLESGQRVLQEALQDPNVKGIIFNNTTYGYGHGSTPQDYSSGHTGNPTQDHQDHVHIWYAPVTGAKGPSGGTQSITTPDGTQVTVPDSSILGPDGQPLPSTSGLPPTVGPTFDNGTKGKKGKKSSSGLGSLFSPVQDPSTGKDLPDSIQPGKIAEQLGGIAMQLVGGFLGIDFSQISGVINKITGDTGSQDEQLPYGSDPQAQSEMDQYSSGDTTDANYDYTGGGGDLYSGESNAISSMTPDGGSEQWRPIVRQVLNQVAGRYGIKNVQAWENALVKQIQTESGGNAQVGKNLSDSNAAAGHPSEGLLQFVPSTYAAHNISGAPDNDPVGQIYAAIDYVVNKYGMNADGSPRQIGQGIGFSGGGKVMGPGTSTSDSIPAWLSRDEHVTRAAATNYYGHKVFDDLNAMRIPKDKVMGLAGGGWWQELTKPPVPVNPPRPVVQPGSPGIGSALGGAPSAPPPAAGPPAAQPGVGGALGLPGSAPTPGGIGGALGTGAPAPAPVTNPLPQPSVQGQAPIAPGVGEGLAAAAGGSGFGQPGAAPAPGGEDAPDPRAAIGQAPTSQDHLNPAVKGGIEGAFQAIGSAAGTAAGVLGGPAGGAAASGIQAGAQVAGQVASGVANVIASGLVGTLSGGSTAGAYGVPLQPQQAPKQTGVPAIQNIYNGGIQTSNLDEFQRGQNRREAQQSMPFLSKW